MHLNYNAKKLDLRSDAMWWNESLNKTSTAKIPSFLYPPMSSASEKVERKVMLKRSKGLQCPLFSRTIVFAFTHYPWLGESSPQALEI